MVSGGGGVVSGGGGVVSGRGGGVFEDVYQEGAQQLEILCLRPHQYRHHQSRKTPQIQVNQECVYQEGIA